MPESPTNNRDWWRQSVVYQIYPRSFTDSDGDGLGDLRGITSRVPYLAGLGIDAIWLSPFYPSPLADGGYDVSNYRNVDPRLGTLEDFDTLATAVHDAGLKLIVDIVPNHSSDEHQWFRDALAAGPRSPERGRYLFRDGTGPSGGNPPSNWSSHFGGSAWTRVTNPSGGPGQWYLHLFSRAQPDWNWEHPDVRQDFHRTLRFWADRGVDGFRVDVANLPAKDMSEPLKSQSGAVDDLTPEEGQSPTFDRDRIQEIYRGWRDVFNEYDPPRSAVAEAWVPAEKRAIYASPEGLGQAFNFDLLVADWNAAQFRSIISENLTQARVSGTSSTWVFSNHDVVRHASRYALPGGTDLDAWLLTGGQEPAPDPEAGLRRARAATQLMLALPGSAYIYQGEELGLFEVADLPPESLQDPIWERTGHRRKGRDGCRVPLPWASTGASLGFGPDGAHLPQPPWFVAHAVEAQEGHRDSTLEFYRRALHLRRELQGTEELYWPERTQAGIVDFVRPGGWRCFTNFRAEPVALPDGKVLLASSALSTDASVPAATTVWLAG